LAADISPSRPSARARFAGSFGANEPSRLVGAFGPSESVDGADDDDDDDDDDESIEPVEGCRFRDERLAGADLIGSEWTGWLLWWRGS